ncbi:MAG: hypothetical protein AAB267_02265 [Candidatus Desantisbacteria bacterium]
MAAGSFRLLTLAADTYAGATFTVTVTAVTDTEGTITTKDYAGDKFLYCTSTASISPNGRQPIIPLNGTQSLVVEQLLYMDLSCIMLRKQRLR